MADDNDQPRMPLWAVAIMVVSLSWNALNLAAGADVIVEWRLFFRDGFIEPYNAMRMSIVDFFGWDFQLADRILNAFLLAGAVATSVMISFNLFKMRFPKFVAPVHNGTVVIPSYIFSFMIALIIDINAIIILHHFISNIVNFVAVFIIMGFSITVIYTIIIKVFKGGRILAIFLEQGKYTFITLAPSTLGLLAAILPFLMLVFAFGKAFAPLPAAG